MAQACRREMGTQGRLRNRCYATTRGRRLLLLAQGGLRRQGNLRTALVGNVRAGFGAVESMAGLPDAAANWHRRRSGDSRSELLDDAEFQELPCDRRAARRTHTH